MPETAPFPAPDRAALRARLRGELTALDPPLRLVAEEIRGDADGIIDWIAAEPDGRAVVGLLEVGEAPAGLLVEALVQRAWVAARLVDWLKLAPGLGIDPALRPRLVLVAAAFPRAFRIAAREADAGGIWLLRLRGLPRREPPPEPRLGLDVERSPSAAAGGPPAGPAPGPSASPGPDSTATPRPVRSTFRTSLTDADLVPGAPARTRSA